MTYELEHPWRFLSAWSSFCTVPCTQLHVMPNPGSAGGTKLSQSLSHSA